MATTHDKKDQQDQAPATAAREAQRAVDPPEDAEKFDHEWLINAPAVGFPPHEIAGALSAISKHKLTIEETRAAVEAWLTSVPKEA